ncbi:MAG: hypothetical protein DRQ55_15985 [Planctomycetota bacterium]|nr:MAG: hypothetical protein DRQ55_15985 [Planctomycetota bacterium]
MSARTLRNWHQAVEAPSVRAVGRPPRGALGWRVVVRDVQRALVACGEVGWRTVHVWLGALHSTDAVQRALSWVMARVRWRRARWRERHARRLLVLGAGRLWSLDGTHVGRDGRGRALETQDLKDNGSRLLLVADIGGSVSGEEAVALLEAGRQAHGGLPLALLSDNGAPYTSGVFESYLTRERVVHILNLPHTPQHNGACEQIHRELKAEARLGKGVTIGSLPAAADAVHGALKRLNTRPRGVLGGKSATAQHTATTRRYTPQTREIIHESRRRAMDAALSGTGSHRARRLAARRAALATLERYGIIKQTRGNDDGHVVKPEDVS